MDGCGPNYFIGNAVHPSNHYCPNLCKFIIWSVPLLLAGNLTADKWLLLKKLLCHCSIFGLITINTIGIKEAFLLVLNTLWNNRSYISFKTGNMDPSTLFMANATHLTGSNFKFMGTECMISFHIIKTYIRQILHLTMHGWMTWTLILYLSILLLIAQKVLQIHSSFFLICHLSEITNNSVMFFSGCWNPKHGPVKWEESTDQTCSEKGPWGLCTNCIDPQLRWVKLSTGKLVVILWKKVVFIEQWW